MAVGVVLEFPYEEGVYDRLSAAVREEFGERSGPEGSLFHAAGRTAAGGWCMCEIWESREALQRWQSGGLLRAMQRAGVSPQPPTHMTMFDVAELDTAPGS